MATLNEALAEELRRRGVNAVFGLLGEDVVKLGVELERRGVTYYGARHESVAVAMADGYARVSGDLGVVIISRGPGVTNALTALVTAARAGSRVVAIAGDCDPGLRGSIYSKYVDQAVLFTGAGVGFVTVDSAESAVADLAAICDRARAGVTVVANFPGGILNAEAGDAPTKAMLPAAPPEGGNPDPEAISLVADLLAESWAFRRPVILAGRGAVWSGAREELQRLADACGALLGTTLMARSLFAGDRFDIGIVGTFSTKPAIELLADADVVLAFGSSLDTFTTLDGAIFPKARVIRFDRAPSAAEGGSVPVEMFVESDVRLAAAALADELARRGHSATGYRTEETAMKIAAFQVANTISDRSRPGALDPRALMMRIDEVIPRERTLVTDIGHNFFFSTAYLSVPEPSAFIFPLEFVCLGAGMGLALGATVASRSRLTVYATGDAGMMMTLGDLETAVRYNLPLLVLVTNDSALGAELHFLQTHGLPADIVRCSTPSFEEVARALGADGCTIESLDDVPQLRGRVERLERPLVVDCRVTTEVRYEGFEYALRLSRSS